MRELTARDLYRTTEFDGLEFETTEELEPLGEVLGQPRAVAAVEFGMQMPGEGYNIFALGSPGTGRFDVVRGFLDRAAADSAPGSDLCYVNDFDEPRRPRLLVLPAGRGESLRHDMEALIEELQSTLTAAFESEEYQNRRQAIEEELKAQQGEVFEKLSQKAKEEGIRMVRTPVGVAFAPVRDGEPVSQEEFNELPDDERQRLEAKVEELQEELQRLSGQVPGWQRERREKLRQLNREITDFAIGPLITELRNEYGELDEVVAYLDAVEADLVERARALISRVGSDDEEKQEAVLSFPGGEEHPLERRYRINLLVDHGGDEQAPVVYEDNPTHQNLLGRIEHLPHRGALLTDFNLIRAGALHRANGGYLMLDAIKILQQPFAWEALKRVLRSGEIKIESPAEALSLISTVSLEPQPAPLDVKVVLVGPPFLYYALSALDADFDRLFKVAADFAEELEREDDNQRLYVRFLARLIAEEDLRPFSRAAAARVVEHGARAVSDAQRLSLATRDLRDLLREASHLAARAGREVVAAEDVQEAIDGRIFRADRLRQRVQDEIERGVLMIDTEGRAVGRVNGLAVLQLGGFAFGRPNRITARVRLGKGEVLDIEREVKLAGPIHSKGVLILAGFVGQRYAADHPLSLSASLVMEQSYGPVEGDSASLAELCALLSAIGQVPVRQSVALTGSVSQQGRVQPVGGVNEKIEGFFDTCTRRGLDGEYGVLIPAANVQHLMLRRDVVEAVESDRFHVWAVDTVDEAMEVLSGESAGEPDEEGTYPAESVNGRVQRRLAALAEQRLRFGKQALTEGGPEA